MRRAMRAALAGLLLCLWPGAPSRAASHTPREVSFQAGQGAAQRWELPGPLRSWAAVRRPDGGSDLYILAGPAPLPEPGEDDDKGPCDTPAPAAGADRHPSLHRLDARAMTLDELRGDLPDSCTQLLASGGAGAGPPEPLLLCAGGFHRATGSGPLEKVLADEEAASGSLTGAAVRLLEGVRFYGRGSEGGWSLASEIPLPLSVSVRGGGLRLSSDPLRTVAGTDEGHALFAVGPDRQGSQRLRTILIDPSAAPGAARVDAWSRLPDPELPLESAYLLLDGHPALVAVTRPADKLSFFGEKLVRLFLLDERDRSRTGGAPLFAVESGANLWQRVVPVTGDVTGDGREDLVLAYWKGLRESRLVLDAYARQQDGTFRAAPRTTERTIPDANRSFLMYGRDLDGDGKPDLAVAAGGALRILRGLPSADGRNLVEERPAWAVPLLLPKEKDSMDIDFDFESPDQGELRWAPRDPDRQRVHLVDLDGNGRPELLAFTTAESGAAELTRIVLGDR
jgi:hypothetical protein